jgi:hypothetical protein
MAKKKVIHADIRPGWEKTCNIMCQHKTNNSAIKLRLIDFESLVVCPIQSTRDGRSMPTHFDIRSAFTFLWWQVLHTAYIWFKKLDNENSGTTLVQQFILKMLDRADRNFADFRNEFSDDSFAIMIEDEKASAESVTQILDIVAKEVFGR